MRKEMSRSTYIWILLAVYTLGVISSFVGLMGVLDNLGVLDITIVY